MKVHVYRRLARATESFQLHGRAPAGLLKALARLAQYLRPCGELTVIPTEVLF